VHSLKGKHKQGGNVMYYNGYANYYGMSPILEPSELSRFGGGQPPGFQPPPFGGGQQGFPPFGGGPQQGGAPQSPPPSYTPQESPSLYAVDPGAIRGCLYRYTYIWLNNGSSFWFYPTYVGRDSIAGYRWRGFRWVYYGTDLRRIRSFRCS
jgi:hypothetical protein